VCMSSTQVSKMYRPFALTGLILEPYLWKLFQRLGTREVLVFTFVIMSPQSDEGETIKNLNFSSNFQSYFSSISSWILMVQDTIHFQPQNFTHDLFVLDSFSLLQILSSIYLQRLNEGISSTLSELMLLYYSHRIHFIFYHRTFIGVCVASRFIVKASIPLQEVQFILYSQ
jgi:hypothetical protein